MLQDPAAQLDELLVFERLTALLAAEDLVLHALQFVSDVALAVDGGLLAMVVGGHAADVRLGDLYEVAKDGVVFNLEALDPSALDFAVLQVSDPLATERGGVAEFVELRQPAFAKHAAFFDLHRRLIGDGTLDFLADVGEVVEALGEMGQIGPMRTTGLMKDDFE